VDLLVLSTFVSLYLWRGDDSPRMRIATSISAVVCTVHKLSLYERFLAASPHRRRRCARALCSLHNATRFWCAYTQCPSRPCASWSSTATWLWHATWVVSCGMQQRIGTSVQVILTSAFMWSNQFTQPDSIVFVTFATSRGDGLCWFRYRQSVPGKSHKIFKPRMLFAEIALRQSQVGLPWWIEKLRSSALQGERYDRSNVPTYLCQQIHGVDLHR